ncbi:hypothetical protein ACP4OV_024436 [Aristida adscensionis]
MVPLLFDQIARPKITPGVYGLSDSRACAFLKNQIWIASISHIPKLDYRGVWASLKSCSHEFQEQQPHSKTSQRPKGRQAKPQENPADHPLSRAKSPPRSSPSPHARPPCPVATAAADAERPPLPPLDSSLGSDQACTTRRQLMDPAMEELERRSRYLISLVRRTKLDDPPRPEPEPELRPEEPSGREGKPEAEAKAKGEERAAAEERKVAVRVRAADMPLSLQRRAVRIAVEAAASMPRVENKRLALALKKDFDSTYGPAWHCIVGTSFGSYVTHSLGGFLYFSIDKVHILLFRTAVEPLGCT